MLSFWYLVSSDGWDVFAFYMDGEQYFMGFPEYPSSWLVHSIPIPPGEHLLEWCYRKDLTGSMGLDTAFVDDIVIY